MAHEGVTPETFYEALWGNYTSDGFIELRPMRPHPEKHGTKDARPEFHQWPGQLGTFVARAQNLSESELGWDVYHGVAVRSRPHGGNDDVAAITTLWCEFDFKSTPQDKVVQALKTFPMRASAGIMSGGGIHAYWFLKDPVVGDDLKKVRAHNRALARGLGADINACDLARILRVPGTLNRKYAPPRRIGIVVWRPELSYSFGDFEDFFPTALADDKPKSAAPASAGGDADAPAPGTRGITAALKEKIAPLIAGIWAKGYRHQLALYLGGLLAHAGYTQEAALEVLRFVATLAHDDEVAERERAVTDTFAKFAAGGAVGGAPSIQKLIEAGFPQAMQADAQKVFDLVQRSISGKRGPMSGERRGMPPDFEVMKVVKFDSRPARYTVEIKVADGTVKTCTCETGIFANFKLFRVSFYEENNVFLAAIKQWRWERLLMKAPLEAREAPQEARVEGAVDAAFEEFVKHRKENPEIGELKAFVGFDDAHTFFRLSAFKGFLREQGVKASDQLIIHHLRKMGWESMPKRMKGEVARVWATPSKLNGQPPPDLFKSPDQPTEPAPPVTPPGVAT
jgi:hypothetical protein